MATLNINELLILSINLTSNSPINIKFWSIHENQYIYLRRFVKTKHSILFRLSNKTVQISFHDNTEIILSHESKTVTYINKRGEKFLYQLNMALDSDNKEMTKRLRYTKKILLQMLTSKGNPDIHKIFNATK